MSETTLRFIGRAGHYQKYRPSYPAAIQGLLAGECGLRPGALALDAGAGTGIFSCLLLDWGYRVLAVEPNPEMRAVAEEQLGDRPGYASLPGTAGDTGAGSGSVDFITAAQAFHWFDREAARREFERILKPEGQLLLIWNERREDTVFLSAFEAFLQQYGTDYNASRHRHIPEEQIRSFYGPAGCELAVFANAQVLDREALRGRVMSCSYVPLPGEARFEPMENALGKLFESHERGGQVTLEYETRVYWGKLSS